jgi:phage tail tube protein FII
MSQMREIVHGWALFCDGVSKHLVTETVQLPALTTQTRDFTPGGGHMGYQVGLSAVAPLTMSFSLINRDPETMALFGLATGRHRTYTLIEQLIDEMNGDAKRRVVTVIGCLNSIESAQNRSPDLIGMQYQVGSVHTYTDAIGSTVVHGFYLKSNRRIVNGVEVTAQRNRILGI